MPSIRSLTSLAGGLLSQIPFLSSNDPVTTYQSGLTSAPTCPIDSPTSCQNSTVAPDSCCFIYPGGQLLQTQFWDTSPSVGPVDSWTLHGLWPDLCDGSYPTYCRSTPQTHSITSLLSTGAPTLLQTMQKYWLPNAGTLEHFWEHEFNKHATCINTLAPSCYGDAYTTGDEIVDFFTRAVEVFQGLDTYAALSKAGIVPSTSATYTLAQIEDALTSITGFEAVVGCRSGRLNQAWYSFNVKGSLQTGQFVPVPPVGKSGRSSCPQSGIKYLPKSGY